MVDAVATVGVREHIRRSASRLEAAGLPSPRADAERIVAYVLGCSWSDLWAPSNSGRVGEGEAERIDAAVARRAAGEPLAYIEGSCVFGGLELVCGPGVLVPRHETETLVEVALELVEQATDRPIVVDIGTGTGAIALAIAAARPDAQVVATDVSEAALAYAHRNATALGIHVLIRHGDLFGAVPEEVRGRIDLIVSNPPYVARGAELPADVRAEPDVALYGGPDGCDVLRTLVSGAPEWLGPGGALVLEIGTPGQAGVLPGAQVRCDMSGRPRVIWKRS